MDYTNLHSSEGTKSIANEDPILEGPALKNPFCRRSGQDRRSGKERRTSADATKRNADRRSGVDRRKGQHRRKYDYWNTNYRYWYGNK